MIHTLCFAFLPIGLDCWGMLAPGGVCSEQLSAATTYLADHCVPNTLGVDCRHSRWLKPSEIALALLTRD